MTRNHNIRFNMDKDADIKAWNIMHDPVTGQHFRSQNAFVVAAINDYYDRILKTDEDPYLETREKEEAFAERIVKAVEARFINALPELIGRIVLNGSCLLPGQQDKAVNRIISENDETVCVDELPDNDLLDFDAF